MEKKRVKYLINDTDYALKWEYFGYLCLNKTNY